MTKFKIGDMISLPAKTTVIVNGIDIFPIKGVIVGKASNDLTQLHIIKCIDGTYPNIIYPYDVFVAPLHLIEVIEGN